MRNAAAIRSKILSSTACRPRVSGADHRIFLGDAIVEELRAHASAVRPASVRVLVRLQGRAQRGAQRRPPMRSSCATARSRARTSTGLHETHLSPWRMAENPDAAATRLTGRLDDIAEHARRRDRLARSAHARHHRGGSGLLGVRRRADLAGFARRDRPADAGDPGKPGALRPARSAHGRRKPRNRRAAGSSSPPCATSAGTDPTTALPNRATFNGTLAKCSRAPRDPRQPISVDAVRSRLLRGLQRELRKLHGRPGAAFDRPAVQGADARERYRRALRRRRVRRDPAADAGERRGRRLRSNSARC